MHLGHKRILARLRERKQELALDRSLLITFHPHPQEVLRRNGLSVELLTTIDERIELIEKEGIDEILIIKFTPGIFANVVYRLFSKHHCKHAWHESDGAGI